MSAQRVSALGAELCSVVDGRRLDDNAQMLLRFDGGARGGLWASQAAPGHANELRLRVYGSLGGLGWRQQQPDQLLWTPLGQPTQILQRGGPGAGAAATRIPGGHPEGYLEAFAMLYSEVAQHLRAARPGGPPADPAAQVPGLEDGLRGLLFIEAAVASSQRGGRWVRLPA